MLYFTTHCWHLVLYCVNCRMLGSEWVGKDAEGKRPDVIEVIYRVHFFPPRTCSVFTPVMCATGEKLTPVVDGTCTVTRRWSDVNSNEICTTYKLFNLLFIPVLYLPVYIINGNIEERYSSLCTRHDSTDMHSYGPNLYKISATKGWWLMPLLAFFTPGKDRYP
jgi:hypothetical protein